MRARAKKEMMYRSCAPGGRPAENEVLVWRFSLLQIVVLSPEQARRISNPDAGATRTDIHNAFGFAFARD
jgi:hypothetical protein